jgi:hypothetical protein
LSHDEQKQNSAPTTRIEKINNKGIAINLEKKLKVLIIRWHKQKLAKDRDHRNYKYVYKRNKENC